MATKKMTLVEVGKAYRTDKNDSFSEAHNYLPFYQADFEAYRDLPITVVEVGVWTGESLKMWREYFTKATIVGIDVDPSKLAQFQTDGWADQDVHVVKCDMNDMREVRETFQGICNAYGAPTIVIDDGGHTMQGQQNCLYHASKVAVPYKKKPAIIAIEDLHTSSMHAKQVYNCDFGVSADGHNTTLRLLNTIAKLIDEEIESTDGNDVLTATMIHAIAAKVKSISYCVSKWQEVNTTKLAIIKLVI